MSIRQPSSRPRAAAVPDRLRASGAGALPDPGGSTMTIGPGDGRSGAGRPRRRPGYRTRSYYLPDDLHFRLRSAWWHTQARGEHDSLSALVAAALRPVVEELESRYNGGGPLPGPPQGGGPATGARRRRPAGGGGGGVQTGD